MCFKSKEDIVCVMGVDEFIVYDEASGTFYEDYISVDFVSRVMEIIKGEGVKVVIDGIGFVMYEIFIDVLVCCGIFVFFGNVFGVVSAFSSFRFINKFGYLICLKLNDYIVICEEFMECVNDIFGWIFFGEF